MSPQACSRFSELPVELRIKIWSFAEPNRVVRCQKSTKDNYSHRFGDHVPLILHICRESRREGLKRYQLFFHDDDDDNKITNSDLGFCPPFYFDFNMDVLHPHPIDGVFTRIFVPAPGTPNTRKAPRKGAVLDFVSRVLTLEFALTASQEYMFEDMHALQTVRVVSPIFAMLKPLSGARSMYTQDIELNVRAEWRRCLAKKDGIKRRVGPPIVVLCS